MDYKLYDAKDSKGKEIVLGLMQIYTKELSLYADETTHFNLLDNGLYNYNFENNKCEIISKLDKIIF